MKAKREKSRETLRVEFSSFITKRHWRGPGSSCFVVFMDALKFHDGRDDASGESRYDVNIHNVVRI